MKPSKPDLHTHSVYSDGLYTPHRLCQAAREAGITHISLCDHDAVAGLALMREFAGSLRFIPGVELSCGGDGNLHILGYGVNENSARLNRYISAAVDRRGERGAKMLRKLRELGIDVPEDMLPQGSPFSRSHVARALTALGHVPSISQAFERYLAEGRPAYVPLQRPNAAEAVSVLRASGGVPVLAHPMRLGLELTALEALIRHLTAEGLRGLEVYHPSASRREIALLDALARRVGLIVTGGSDFHGDAGAHSALGALPGDWTSVERDLTALLEEIRQAS